MALDLTGIGSVAALLKDGLDRLFPNKSDPAYIQAQAALIQAQTAGTLKELDDQFQLMQAQAATNTAEAAQPGLHFRDGAGWVCVAGFAVSVMKPLVEWGFAIAGKPLALPPIDTTTSVTLLGALLGVGTMHVYQTTQSK